MNPTDYTDYAAYGQNFALLLDGRLDPETGRELERKLAADPQLRQFYYEYVKVHAMLRRELEGRGQDGDAVDPSQTLGVIFSGSADRASGAQPQAAATSRPATTGGRASRQATAKPGPVLHRWVRNLSIAAVLALVMLTAYGLWSYLGAADPTLARVTGSHDAYWETPADGDEVKPGEVSSGELLLRTGQIELTYDDGTVATLDAPARVNLISQSHLRLTRGWVYVVAPPGVSGFEVSTPGASAVDLGTEFGVSYSANLVTEVHVFKGRVSVAPSRHMLAGGIEPADVAVQLSAGEAGWVLPDASLQQGHKADADLFVRDVHAFAGSGQIPPATRESWLAYRDRLRTDQTLVACYDFTRRDGAPNVLRNVAFSTGSRLNGSLGLPLAPETMPRWVRGRFPDGQALWFRPELKQFVLLPKDKSLDIKGDMTAAWWMYPVHTYNRDYAMVVLGNGAPRSDYQAELEEDNHYYAFGLKMGKLRALHESGAGVNQEVLSSREIEPERWTHVAVVRDSDRLEYRLYIDGELTDTVNYKANMTGGESAKSQVTIGRSGGALLNHFDGILDEMMIYSRALPSQEIQQIYLRSRPAQ